MKNLGREFATMSDDERRRYMIQREASDNEPEELKFEDPRPDDLMGRKYATPKDETADPGSRDGASALLDDDEHARNVERQSEGSSPED